MKLIADSGSTKTDWVIIQSEERLTNIHTQGINPFHQAEEVIENILRQELLPQLSELLSPTLQIDAVEFYGAGCNAEKSLILESILRKVFPSCNSIIVGSDMLGAAKALCGSKPGVACILGTGANSCLYDGNSIIENVSPMGYILGDEGSGAVIGRCFINELYKGAHRDFIPVFENATGLNMPLIINKVYREPLANRFLASLCLFIGQHKDSAPWIKELIIDCFCKFFSHNIRHYNHHELSVNFVGSIAYHFQEELRQAASLEGFKVGKILKSPL